MIWTQHQAELISDIYSLLENPSSPLSASPSGSPRLPSSSPPSSRHRRHSSNVSSSSSEIPSIETGLQSPAIRRTNSVLVTSPDEVPDINNSSFLVADAGESQALLEPSSTRRETLKRSIARAGRISSVNYKGHALGLPSQRRARRHSNFQPTTHPVSLTIHGDGFDFELTP